MHLNWNEILASCPSNGIRICDQMASKEMLACVVVPEAVEILNYVVCVGKHVIVTI